MFLAMYLTKSIKLHLDYGDVIYHRHDPRLSLDATKRLEQTQYSAALAITGAWRGTSRQRLYDQLRWENVHDRRWFRCLCHFFNLRKSHHPVYLFAEIPDAREVSYSLRSANEYEPIIHRTVRFSHAYFHNVLVEWDVLDKDLR